MTSGRPGESTEIIDTHVHVACPDVARYPRRPTGVGSSWWSGPEGDADHVLAEARRGGVAHVVVVQAVGAYGHDCSCAGDVVAGDAEGFTSLVASIDMTDPAVALRSLDDDRPVRLTGLRLFGVADGAPWLDDGRADEVWDWAAQADLVIVPTIFTDRLGSLGAVIERHPTTPVALDHCAFPDMSEHADERDLLALGDLSSLRLKLSTHVLEAWEVAGRLDDAFAAVVDAFGSERMCWGSDHPQHQGSTYADKIVLARRAARRLDDGQRHDFLAGTARRLGWAPPS